MTTRRTSIYVMTMPFDPELADMRLDTMNEIVGTDTAGSVIYGDGTIVFGFRASDDATAVKTADALSFGRAYQVATGLGIHCREVVAA